MLQPDNFYIELHKLIDNEVNHILPFRLEQYFVDKITSTSELRQLIREEVKDLLARENEVKSKKIEQEIDKYKRSSAECSSTPKEKSSVLSGTLNINSAAFPLLQPMNFTFSPPPVMVLPERVKCQRSGCKEMKAKREVRGTVFLNDSVYMNVIVYLCDKCFADCESTGKPDYPGSCMEKK